MEGSWMEGNAVSGRGTSGGKAWHAHPDVGNHVAMEDGPGRCQCQLGTAGLSFPPVVPRSTGRGLAQAGRMWSCREGQGSAPGPLPLRVPELSSPAPSLG